MREIRRRYGAAAHTTVQAHPYRLVRDITGMSFAVADTLARKLGTGKTNPERIRTGVIEVLQQALRNGHTSLPLPVVVKRAAALLGVSRPTVEEQCLRGALDVGGEFVVDRRGAQTLLTSVTLRRVEERVAEALADRVRRPLPPVLSNTVEEITSSVAQTCGLNAEQQYALRSTLTHPLTVVTGGPGTGKSFFCQALATVAAQQHLPLLAAAPTGRAAQRLTEMAGVPAATLHRLLEYHPGTETFQRNAEAPLAASLVIIDEASMVDLFLLDALLAALPLAAHLVLLGDVDQLPSVGPGQVLADLIASGIAQVVRFTQLYRRAAESGITLGAHRVREAQVPRFAEEAQADFRFIEEADPQKAIERIVELVAQEVPAATGCDPYTDIQVLCPLNQEPAGTLALNRALQQRLNPQGRQVQVGEREFRIGDRVLVTQNNYRLGVFNGESGILVQANAQKPLVVVRTEHGDAAFVGPELAALTLGYAVSVHRAQGGEFPIVIVFLHDLHAPLLQRTLLYTAITRAKQCCLIVGTKTALTQAVRNQRSLQRYPGLAAALQRAGPGSTPRSVKRSAGARCVDCESRRSVTPVPGNTPHSALLAFSLPLPQRVA